jgi:hypothetical protein
MREQNYVTASAGPIVFFIFAWGRSIVRCSKIDVT